jgi:stage II sporulation protein AA (anti-sigma F factor antagonist)
MLSQPQTPWLEVETVGDVAVARFTRGRFLDEQTVQSVGEQLLRLSELTGCCKFVLNFSKVESMTTALFGKLIALHKQVEGKGGRLALCQVSPFLREIFKILTLPRQVAVFDGEQEALQSF